VPLDYLKELAAYWPTTPAPPDDAAPARSGPPTGVAVFAADTAIRSRLDPGGTMHWSEFDRGGHFPAMEHRPARR
jgi:hypothetical protein